MDQFLESETWLTVEIWNAYQADRMKQTNRQSRSTANVAVVLEAIWASFNNANDKFNSDPTRFLPYREIDDNHLLDIETIEIYWESVNRNLVPPFVRRAIQLNSQLFQSLESGKKIVQ